MIKPEEIIIIIPHLGKTEEQRRALKECLTSLKETFKGSIIVAQNGGFSYELDYPLPAGLTILYSSSQGQCRAVNEAVKITPTPWIFVTNDDMVFPNDWFNKLTMGVVNPNGKGIKCISPKLVEPRSGAPTFDIYFCGGAGGDFDKSKFYEYEEKREIKTVDIAVRTGFNLPYLISKKLWDIIEGYDINYDPWSSNSDSDLEYKIKLAGVQPYQNTNCLVYHFSQTSGTFHPDNHSYWQKNWDYFIEKWGFPRTDDGIWEATFEIPKPPIRKFTPDWENKYK